MFWTPLKLRQFKQRQQFSPLRPLGRPQRLPHSRRRLRLEPLEQRQMLDSMTIIETPLVEGGDEARILIPTIANGGDQLGDTWQGAGENEPFDDSLAAGWIQGPTSVGFGDLQLPLAIAGELFVDLDATDASAGGPAWANNGTLGDFLEVGDPLFQVVDGVPAVTFNGTTDAYQSPVNAPDGLVGEDPTRSIEIWVYNPTIPSEETMLSWGKRGGPDGSNISFNYGNNGRSGAVVHQGESGPDLGWVDNSFTPGAPEAGQWHHLVYTYDGTTTRVYSDGVLQNEEFLDAGTINTHTNTKITVASQLDADGVTLNGNLKGSLSIAKIRVHDGVLSDTDIQNNFDLEKGQFGFIVPDLVATPNVLTIYKRIGGPDPGEADLTITNDSGAALDNVTFGSAISPFSGPFGGDSDVGTLPNGESATRSYRFDDDVFPETGSIQVSAPGASPVIVSVIGTPVGPDARFRSGSTDLTAARELNFTVSPTAGAATKLLIVGNETVDGDFGDLTDLTVISASFMPDPEGRFTLLSDLSTIADSVLSAGDMLDAIEIQFDSGGVLGVYGGASITFETDQGQGKGVRGENFTIDLTANVQVIGELPEGPVHRYRFNDAGSLVADSVGSADGQIKGTGGSQSGGRLNLSGGASDTASYVDLPNGIISDLTDATFETWVTIDAAQNWSRIFDFGVNSAGEQTGPGGNFSGTNYVFLSANRKRNPNQRLEFRGEAGKQLFNSNGTTEYGRELHIVVTFDDDADELKYYKDGILIATTITANRLVNLEDVNNWLGRSNWSTDWNLDGSYDEFRIYDYALDVDQINSNFQLGPDIVNAPGGSPQAAPVPAAATENNPAAAAADTFGTDLQTEMGGVNASALIRIPFEIVGNPDFDFLKLRMQFDDGFVAYINGTEVASANAPGRDGNVDPLLWNSTSTVERPPQDLLEFVEYSISPDVLISGTNVLAIHGLNLAASDGDFVILPELIGQSVPRDQVQPVGDAYALEPNTTLNMSAASGLLANDLNPDGAPLLVSLVDDVTQGALNLSDDGSFSYTPPNPAFIGDVTFTYKILDLPDDPPNPMIVSVTLSVDTPPSAADDRYDAVEDEVLSVSAALGVLKNDSDVELDSLSAVLISQPARGNVNLAADGSFTYTPEANFFGPDSFTYRAFDGDQSSPLTTVALDVAAVNDPPVAVDDTFFMIEDQRLDVSTLTGVLVNDADVDSGLLTASLVDGPSRAVSFALSGDGSFSYVPTAGFIGSDSFTYRTSDSLLTSNLATVTLIVNSTDQQIVINEIYYDPPENEIHSEFIELYNAGSLTVNLTGWAFTNGIGFVFPDGTTLAPDEYLLIADEPDVVLAEFGKVALGPWQGGLSNNGEVVVLRGATGEKVDKVDYQAEFPWPIAANGDGASMELLNPALDNDLSGSWRSSFVDNGNGGGDNPASAQVTYLDFDQADWRYRKGTSEASSPTDAWRMGDFVEDANWLSGQTPIGYGDGDDATVLADMQNNYSTVYLRNEFTIAAGEIPEQLILSIKDDDGAIVWINGVEVARLNVGDGFMAFNSTAFNHEVSIEQVLIDNPSAFLVEGLNTIAVHSLNQAITSSDLTIDVQVQTPPPPPPEEISRVPTPGEQNSVFALNAPPQIRQVRLDNQTPQSGDEVTLTAKVTDPNGVASVVAWYQVNLPGEYIPALLPLDDVTLQDAPDTPRTPNPAFEDPANWVEVVMTDDGTAGDVVAGDNIYTAVLPTQPNRTLVRYRITVEDQLGAAVTVPYADDPSLNFAYYVYDGLVDYTAETLSFQPTGAGTTYGADSLTGRSIGVYSFIVRNEDINNLLDENLAKPNPPGGDVANSITAQTQLDARKTYNVEGAVVFDGKVYDHVGIRIRGSNSRYAGIKRNFKFRFNRGNYLAARDRDGQLYDNKWKVLVTGRNYGNKFVQNYGLTESINSELWSLFGVPARDTQYMHFRVVDGPDEAPTGANGQYDGDFWGLMLGFEQYDGIFLKNRDLPKGNLYKLADFVFDGKEQQRYQAPNSVSAAEDYDLARFDIIGARDDQWLRDNVNLDEWYRYHTVVDAIRHYDMYPEASGRHRLKNLVWYFEAPTPENPLGKVQFLEYDSDASWGPSFNAGTDQVKFALYNVAPNNSQLQLEYRNTIREFRDLIWTEEVIGGMIDRLAEPIIALSRADRDRWEGNPGPEGSQSYSPGSIEDKVADMKGFAFDTWSGGSGPAVGPGGRAAFLDALSNSGDSGSVPNTPVITNVGDGNYAANALVFQTSPFSDPQGSGTFAAVEWRIGEITDVNSPAYDANAPWMYEYTTVWESGELTGPLTTTAAIPAGVVEAGHAYRARVRMQDSTGRWSHWSAPEEFTATTATTTADLQDFLRIGEIMYHSANPTLAEQAAGFNDNDDFDFVELFNNGNVTLNLDDVQLSGGVAFDFTGSNVTSLAPGEHVLIVEDLVAFESRYGSAIMDRVAGQFAGRLNNSGEQLLLADPQSVPIVDVTYSDLWYGETDGDGFSLVIADTQFDADSADYWRSSALVGGSPGESDATPAAGDANGDGTTNRADVLRTLAGFGLPNASNRTLGDINGDGATSLTDIALLQTQIGATLGPATFPTAAPSAAAARAMVISAVDTVRPAANSLRTSSQRTRSSIATRSIKHRDVRQLQAEAVDRAFTSAGDEPTMRPTRRRLQAVRRYDRAAEQNQPWRRQ